MSYAMELLSPTHALSRLACILDCSDKVPVIRVTAISEFLRASIYQPYYWGTDWWPPQPVHTNKIISAVRRDLRFLWEDTDHPTFISEISESGEYTLSATDILNKLCNVGDIVKLGNGFWAPGPVRIVKTADGREGTLLVIGGAPFETLEKKFAIRISCVGCGRFVHPDRTGFRRLQVEQELQSVDDWLGGPTQDLSTWTQRAFKALVENMSPAVNVEASECEIYAPDELPGKPRRGNWLSIRDFSIVPTGLRLCRPPADKSSSYDRPTYLAVLREDGGIATFRQLALVPIDIRLRLMFGFEQLHGIQRTVTIEINDQICRTRVPFKLPDPESRILAFGWPVGTDQNGRPIVFEFSSNLVPFLIEVLTKLNIRITKIHSPETKR
ncbi:hypothetical protein F4212_14985 [Candidatus Poribacteria bacterium]|nr:hypothetical protein [Candidatus Poribacteria bacterium]